MKIGEFTILSPPLLTPPPPPPPPPLPPPPPPPPQVSKSYSSEAQVFDQVCVEASCGRPSAAEGRSPLELGELRVLVVDDSTLIA